MDFRALGRGPFPARPRRVNFRARGPEALPAYPRRRERRRVRREPLPSDRSRGFPHRAGTPAHSHPLPMQAHPCRAGTDTPSVRKSIAIRGLVRTTRHSGGRHHRPDHRRTLRTTPCGTRHEARRRQRTCPRAFGARQAGPGLTARPRAVRGAFFSPLHHLLSAQRNAFPLSFLPRIGYKAPLTRRTLPDASGRIPGMTPGG